MTTEGDQRTTLVVRAWEMSTRDGKSVRVIASELGISRASAARYVREAEQAEGYVDLLDRADARVAQAFRLDEYVTLLRRRIDEGAKAEVVIGVLLKVEERLAKLHGTDAPSRVQVENVGQAEVKPQVIEAIREAQRFTAVERDEIDRRGDDDD